MGTTSGLALRLNTADDPSHMDGAGGSEQLSQRRVVSLDDRRALGLRSVSGPIWQKKILSEVVTLSKLPDNWDGYGAPKLRSETCIFALQILEDVMSTGVPVPHVVPSSVGGLQIEWHCKDFDLEFHISSPYNAELWFEDRRGEVPSVSVIVEEDLGPLTAALAALVAR